MKNRVWEKIDSQTLISGAEWADAQSTVRAKVFGKMVELGQNRIKNYQSDLYHDAIWLLNTLIGPMQIDWIARESGTFIGDVVLHVKDDDWPGWARYRFDIRLEGDRKWVLDTYEAVIPYCNHDPVAVVNGVCECGFTVPIEEVEVGPPTTNSSWVDRHAALDVKECEYATAVQGCIWHPAPVGGWTKVFEETPQREEVINDIIDELNIPTLRNQNTRKVNKMDDIINDLREKYREAESTKDQLEEYQSSINDAVDDLDTYMADLDELINSLDSLPEVNVYVDLETVSFDS